MFGVSMTSAFAVWKKKKNFFYIFHLHQLIKNRMFWFNYVICKKKHPVFLLFPFVSLQQFGKILDVEIIFNERGSKVHFFPALFSTALLWDEFQILDFLKYVGIRRETTSLLSYPQQDQRPSVAVVAPHAQQTVGLEELWCNVVARTQHGGKVTLHLL